MRKAGLGKRGSRRKQNNTKEEQTPPVNNESTVVEVPPPERRKPTSEEAALTAKNYRLAKELSELRVRHREECKTVTKLTMDNMNLASRCREAISHVTMLKKELAMHQRRAAEALAMQRQHVQRMASNMSDPGPGAEDDVAPVPALPSPQRVALPEADKLAEMERMDQIMAAHAVAPPLDESSASASASSSNAASGGPEVSPPAAEFFDEFDSSNSSRSGRPPTNAPTTVPAPPETPTPRGSPPPSEENEQQRATVSSPAAASLKTSSPRREEEVPTDELMSEQRFSESTLFPFSASPKLKAKVGNYNEEFPGDITSVKRTFSAERKKLGIAGEITELDEESNSVSSAPSSTALVPVDKEAKKQSSIDAFEASFDTQFPAHFSPREDSKRDHHDTEIYNPFAPSPAKPSLDTDAKWVSPTIRDRSPGHRSGSLRRMSPSPSGRNHGSSPVTSNSPSRKATVSGGSPLALLHPQQQFFPETSNGNSPPEDVQRADEERFRTPPPFVHKIAEGNDLPQRPEKTGAAAARARYEKALHPWGYGSRQPNKQESPRSQAVESGDDGRDVSDGGSPVVRRFQHRRAKERTAGQESINGRRPSADDFSPPLVSNPNAKTEIRRSSWSTRGHYDVDAFSQPSDEEDETLNRSSFVSKTANKKMADNVRVMSNGDSDVLQCPAPSRPLGIPAAHRVSPSSLESRESGSSMNGRQDAPSPRFKMRRTVKQPVSYAEPPLNSKLRRGDVYFPKEEKSDEVLLLPTDDRGDLAAASVRS